MREFVVIGHTAAIDPDFPLDDLPGAAGRLDVLCRCVNAAFVLSHAIREAVRCALVLQDRITIHLDGAELRYLSPDERNIASLLRQAIEAADRAVGHQAVESTPGITVSKRGLEAALADLDGTIVQLHEDGQPLPTLTSDVSPAFVLSDHQDLTPREQELLSTQADQRIAVGPKRLHADHAMIIAHNYFDTDGYRRYQT